MKPTGEGQELYLGFEFNQAGTSDFSLIVTE